MRKVKARWVINLQDGASVKVKVGSVVTQGQLLAEESVNTEKVFNLGVNIDLVGKEIEKDQIIFKTGGIFSKKLLSPISGKVTRVDEFNNVYVITGEGDIKSINSPVDAKVVLVEDGKIELEFKANEYTGDGLTEGREWAKKGLKTVKVLGDLTYADVDKIMIVENISTELLIKAEVVGVKGVVIFGKEVNKVSSKLPILRMSLEEKDELSKDNFDQIALLNAGNGRLLLLI